MVTAYDVEPLKLIKKAAEKLEILNLPQPKWVGNVKSGPSRERLPQDDKFWFVRCASLLRKAYVASPIGVNKMRTHYGTRKSRGVRPEHHVKSGGNMIRKGMQALEKAGLLAKKKVGRYITPKGQALLDSCAKELSAPAEKPQ